MADDRAAVVALSVQTEALRAELAQVTAERDDLLTALSWDDPACPNCEHGASLHGLANPTQRFQCRGEARETYETCGCLRTLQEVASSA